MKHIGNYIGETAYCIEHTPGVGEQLDPIFSDTEADSPTHCSVCEVLIPHRLTAEGIRFVAQAIAERLEVPPQGRRPIIKQWWEWYGDLIPSDILFDEITFTIGLWPDDRD